MKQGETPIPDLILNGIRLDVHQPEIEFVGAPATETIVTFSFGGGVAIPLYVIGSQVTLQFGEVGPATFKVIGISETDDREIFRYRVRLKQIESRPADTMALLYGAVTQTILNRARIRAVLKTLEAKGTLTSSEVDASYRSVVEDELVDIAASIVSEQDAHGLRELVLKALDEQEPHAQIASAS